MKSKKIIFTGGGSAGHVTPNLAIMPYVEICGYEIIYIGSKEGIEKDIINEKKYKYYGISSGKLRRYFDVKNFTDPFKVLVGLKEAYNIIKAEKPAAIFSKGGFVSVPVVIAGAMNKVPVITHESDLTPGLANKISTPFCSCVCVTFPETLEHIKKNKGVLTGTPIREELLRGDKITGKLICGFKDNKPVILVVGGSLGSSFINTKLREMLPKLINEFNIIHICGKENADEKLRYIEGYRQFQYVDKELSHLLALADMVISRAGANSIYELLALKKPNLLIPLSKLSSRGDQILNAKSFERQGYSMVIEEEQLTGERLLEAIYELYKNRSSYVKAMEKNSIKNSAEIIAQLILKEAQKNL